MITHRSLSRLALRLATVRALRGKTWAGSRVRDSEIGAIDDLDTDEPQPFLIVYTDDGPQPQHLVIEIVMTQRMLVETPEGAEIRWDMPATDAAMELTLDMLEAQTLSALADPANDWAEIARSFILSQDDIKSQRGNSQRDGIRFSGRQITIPVELPVDPLPGRATPPSWTAFLAAAAADPDLAAVVPMLTAAVTSTADARPEWQTIRHTWGLPLATARALLIAPPEGAEASSPDIDPAAGVPFEAAPVPLVIPNPQPLPLVP